MDNFVQINQKQLYQLKLVAITKSDIKNDLIAKVNNKITLISQEKTYFLYLGEKNHLSRTSLRKLFINIINNQELQDDIDIDIKTFTNEKIDDSEALQTIYEAILFASHKSYSLKTQTAEKLKIKYNLLSNSKLPEYTSPNQIETQSQFLNFARDLQDMPPNILYPEIFANHISEKAKGIANLKVTILDKKAIQDLGMNLLLAVNAAAHYEPRVVVLTYNGNPKTKDVLGLVGKGITFDSGGYSLKPSQFMKGMKFDMSGAAIVCNSALAAAKLGLKTNFIAVACVTENKIGGHGTLVETVVKSMNGKTVEINNTDAEGRLVLADGMTYALRKGKATKIIELSTLTGAILVALGEYMTGAFSNSDQLFDNFKIAADQANEELWRMPIHEENIASIKTSPVADLSNISKGSYGGSSSAAAFLQEFCEDKPFLHLDIAGTASNNDRGQAILVKSLVQYMKNNK
ncbi:MAG: M17 family metallopeptidase [Spiroplasma sp.]|nr:M17 family metallopeptidase [Spiroplasma sp.]